MVDFLITDLKVPKAHIIELYDQQASRQAIIGGFEMLKTNNRIRIGDPILIFFSGHGGLTDASSQWKQKYGTNKIQVIFPYDYGIPITKTNDFINCIPDCTVAELLNQLAAAKGDNITVIFDSCHSASGTRDSSEHPGLRARSAEVQFPIPDDIDGDILAQSSIGSKIGRGAELLLHSDQNSHVHIAACGSTQKAWENNGKGFFTDILLDTLRKSRVDNITYENLIKAQSPHCYGQNKNRVLFGSRLGLQTKAFVPVLCTFDARGYRLHLQAGEGSGISEGSVWDLHESATENSPPRANVIAGPPGVLDTPLDLIQKDKRGASWLDQLLNRASGRGEIRVYARHLYAGQSTKLHLWTSSSDLRSLLSATVPNAVGGGIHEFDYILHRERNHPDIQLEIYPNIPQGARITPSSQVRFRLRDTIAERYGTAELKHSKPAIREEIETVLFAAAKWKWHLQRTNSSHSQIQSIRMMKVATKVGRSREYLKEPIIMTENSVGVIEFIPKANDLYGIELVSCAKSPLYIKMFYFDTTDFSIVNMFGDSVARGPEDATLPPYEKMVIGDGRDGGAPLKFAVSSGNRVELGYLKVFWCTGPLELSDLAQGSAFQMRPGSVGRAVGQGKARRQDDWGTICLKLVMKAS
ncbi:hypothetical protein RSOLAG22IIIB_09824 [Rhizoctonia solani]|uniref:Peptidase C14 caspase domain-containing protein n=1 Tax=Rhizoctonia solani TaxID=456999 RepID=A0A0K6G0I8_9AGAM|nr:hypothetical protein RSOLAG22IIIB_09824 [Rhizoctonia solani]